MRTTKLFICFFIFCSKSFGQDTLWKKIVLNEILTLNLPTKSEYNKTSFVKAFGGEVNSTYYGFQYYDTILQPIENEETFKISLTGFMSGRTSDPNLQKYSVEVTDTVINATAGLMAIYRTTDTSKDYKKIYYYVTIANSQYYWFYVYSRLQTEYDEEINFFFKSILFATDKIKEKAYRLPPIHLTKNAN